MILSFTHLQISVQLRWKLVSIHFKKELTLTLPLMPAFSLITFQTLFQLIVFLLAFLIFTFQVFYSKTCIYKIKYFLQIVFPTNSLFYLTRFLCICITLKVFVWPMGTLGLFACATKLSTHKFVSFTCPQSLSLVGLSWPQLIFLVC